jgi:hypothetical protein
MDDLRQRKERRKKKRRKGRKEVESKIHGKKYLRAQPKVVNPAARKRWVERKREKESLLPEGAAIPGKGDVMKETPKDKAQGVRPCSPKALSREKRERNLCCPKALWFQREGKRGKGT